MKRKKKDDLTPRRPEEIIEKTVAKYKEAYKLLTGSDLKD